MVENISNTDTQEMKIKYDGGNTIDANTYINSLIHFTTIVQEVNKELSSENKVEVQIKANKPGSFMVDVLIQSINDGSLKHIFSKDNLDYAKTIIQTVAEVYKVAKHLMGNKPKEIKSDNDSIIRIENNNGQVMNFDFRGANIYLKNTTIKEAISQEFETLDADKNVTGLEFFDKDENELLTVKKEEFYSLSSSGATPELSPDERIEIVTANLNISSMDWEFKKKWDLYYLGNKISAKILDQTFSKRIDKGERFGKGDTLEVKMEIKQQFDETVNAFVNKTYTVIEILNHKERPVQGKLDLPT